MTKDRFAAALDECGERHKGTRIGTLWGRNGHEGDATLTVEFLNSPMIERLDTLKDIIGVLSGEYDNTLKAFRARMEQA